MADMKMIADKDLPQRNPKVIIYAMVPGGHRTNVFTATSTPPDQTTVQSSNLHSTGKGHCKWTFPVSRPVELVTQLVQRCTTLEMF